MMTLASFDRAVKAAKEAAALNPAPAVEVAPAAPAVARVSAMEWAYAILGKYAAVADARQVDHARYLLCDEELASIKITPIGASFAELDARLAQLDADQVAADMAEARGPVTVAEVAPADLAPALTITIKGASYGVRIIPAGEFGIAAVRLTKLSDGTPYDVIRTNDGLITCDCADYEFRHKHTLNMCKHGVALVVVRLLDAPAAPDVPCPECGEVHDPAYDHESDPADWGDFADEVVTIAAGDPPAPAPCCDPQEAEPCRECAPPAEDLIGWERRPRAPRPSAPPSPRPVRPAPLPPGTYSLVELIDGQAAYLRGMDGAPFALMAEALAELASRVRATGAACVADYEDRIAEMDRQRDADLRAQGYALGRDEAA